MIRLILLTFFSLVINNTFTQVQTKEETIKYINNLLSSFEVDFDGVGEFSKVISNSQYVTFVIKESSLIYEGFTQIKIDVNDVDLKYSESGDYYTTKKYWIHFNCNMDNPLQLVPPIPE
jgi:hypothetical protein